MRPLAIDPPSLSNDPAGPLNRRVALRDFSWRGTELAIGLAPILALRGLQIWNIRTPVSRPALGVAYIAWLAGYPLWRIRRRRWRMSWPSRREWVVEGRLVIGFFLLFWIAEYALFWIWTSYFKASHPFGPYLRFVEYADIAKNLRYAVQAVLLAPVAEEMFFRGMLYNGLRQKIGPFWAVTLSALSFSFVHGKANLVVTLTGLILAILYERRQTLLAPILFHALQNGAVGILTLMAAINTLHTPVIGIKGTPGNGGCVVTEVVSGSEVAQAGLRANDFIQYVDGQKVKDVGDILKILGFFRAGNSVRIDLVRDGNATHIDVILKHDVIGEPLTKFPGPP